MEVEKTAEGGDYLKAKFVKENKITELQITDARTITMVEFEGKDGKPAQQKIQCEVTYPKQGKEDPSTWTMNNKSRNALIDAWGKDTDNWVNKKIPIQLGGQGEMEHILVVDECAIIPIYRYVNQGLLAESVYGWYGNIRDLHNLKYIWIDEE